MSAQLGNEAVLVEVRDHVMTITLNRPEARNAVNLQTHLGVGGALEAAEADADVRAVIVTGVGDQAFCAGADLKAISKGERLTPENPEQAAWGFAGLVKHHISKPLIAAVNGLALGGGTEITLACDIAIASDTAAFGLPEVKRGILAGAGGAFRILDQLPRKIAMELLLTGDRISAAKAFELGLVNQVVPQSEVMTEALAMAKRITVNAPLSVQASKRIALGIVDGMIETEAQGWRLTTSEVARVFRSEDAREGPRAFAEKRAPQWKAR